MPADPLAATYGDYLAALLRRGDLADPATAVFTGTNEKDAAGEAVVRAEPGVGPSVHEALSPYRAGGFLPARPPAGAWAPRGPETAQTLWERLSTDPIGAATEAIRGALVGAGEPGEDTQAARFGELLMAAAPFAGPVTRALGGAEALGVGRGLYSRVDDAVGLLPKNGAHPNKIASILKSNASAEELAYRQVPAFLAAKGNATVAPGELAAHLAAHPAPMPTVKTLRGAPSDLIAARNTVEQRAARMRAAAFDDPTDWVGISDVDRANAHWWAGEAAGGDTRALRKLNEIAVDPDHLETLLAFGRARNESTALGRQIEAVPTSKYGNWQVPGGEQYQETLLTLAKPKEPVNHELQQAFTSANENLNAFRRTNPEAEFEGLRNPEYRQLVMARNRLGEQLTASENAHVANLFRSSHFEEPNILVHTRSNMRTLPTGERGRFLEEVQSDWHQQGKQKGYQRDTSQELAALASEWETARRAMMATDDAASLAAQTRMGEITDQMNALHDLASGVPDAPFKESWPDLGLKQQILDVAADPKAEWIGFTGGQTQAARYDLRKQIDQLEWHPDPSRAGTGHLVAMKDGDQVVNVTIPNNAIADHVGKDAAAKLLGQPLRDGQHTLSGLDLQVGGEGMHQFYDQLLPKRLEKIVKPFGGKVEPIRLKHKAHPSSGMDTETSPSWIVRLTPEMKERILRQGLPLLTPLIGVSVGAALAEQDQ